jgi:hypothetical protein
MTDEEERLRQHWQELAEQLGLESGPEPTAVEKPALKATGPASSAPPARAETSKEYSEGKERTVSAREQGPPSSRPVSEEAAPAAWHTEDQPEEDIPEQSSASEGTETVRRRPARKAERGDRPRRPRANDPSRGRETAAETGSPAGESSEEKSGERSRRRRKASSGRPREEDAPASSAEMQPDEPPDAPESRAEEADKDDLDTLTDWNVPSWTELIDSLYRPDR